MAPENASTLDFTTNEASLGVRLDKWIADATDGLTRARIKALIEGGALTRNGETFKNPSWRMREGDVFHLTIPEIETPIPQAEDIPLDVAYEDDDLIVVNKPSGMVVHPAAGNWTGTLVNALIAHCGASLSGVGGVARPGIVHRLDKDTSGLLVVAKNDRAHQGLTAAFAAHDVDRLYEALAVGAPRPRLGVIDAPIGRSSSDRKKFAALKPDTAQPDARHAVTHYKVVDAFGTGRAKLAGDAVACHLECALETGRTHQIRVHLSSIGHPLLGDPLYGRVGGSGLAGVKPGSPAADAALKSLRAFRRQALHARRLGFDHPRTSQRLTFESPPPADFNNLRDTLATL